MLYIAVVFLCIVFFIQTVSDSHCYPNNSIYMIIIVRSELQFSSEMAEINSAPQVPPNPANVDEYNAFFEVTGVGKG